MSNTINITSATAGAPTETKYEAQESIQLMGVPINLTSLKNRELKEILKKMKRPYKVAPAGQSRLLPYRADTRSTR